MRPIHDRMPVIIPPEGEKKWLGELSDEEAVKFLKSYPAEQMKAYEISTFVNSPKNDSPDVVVPAWHPLICVVYKNCSISFNPICRFSMFNPHARWDRHLPYDEQEADVIEVGVIFNVN